MTALIGTSTEVGAIGLHCATMDLDTKLSEKGVDVACLSETGFEQATAAKFCEVPDMVRQADQVKEPDCGEGV